MRAAALVTGLRSRSRFDGAMPAGSLLIALLTSGCLSTIEGGPARLYSVSDEVTQARFLLEEAPISRSPDGSGAVKGLMSNYYAAKTEDDRRFYRNEAIARRMYIIDVQYSDYEASLTRDRQLFGFGTSAASQGLTIGSTLAASQSAARVLSGVAGGVGALKGIYDSELIIAKSIQIIQGQMRAQRDVVGSRIEERMGWTTAAYPLSSALADLEDYYRAGTLNTGLINAARDSGENAIRAGEVRGNAIIVRSGVFAPNETTARTLRAFLTGPQAATRAAAVNTCLAEPGMPRTLNGGPFNFRFILDGSADVATRQAVISCLRRNGQSI